MGRLHNTHGGGSNTNKYGLQFEVTTSLKEQLKLFGYVVKEKPNGDEIFLKNASYPIAILLPKYKLKKYLEAVHKGFNYYSYASKQYLPDEALLNLENRTLYIVEKKEQNVAGSVDEKIGAFPFRKWIYSNMMKTLDYETNFAFLGVTFFDAPKYRDVYDYLKLFDIPVYFDTMDLDFFKLPKP